MKKSDIPIVPDGRPASSPGPGIVATVLSMIIWGLAPLYWTELDGIPSLELIFHRVLWVWAILMPVVFIRKRGGAFLLALRTPKEGGLHLVSGLLLGMNWYSFVWAVLNERVVEVSLGYFILPLINVLLGFLFFQERLSRMQGVAVSLAFIAVLIQLIQYGQVPWTALVVAFSFGFYSLIRKKSSLGSLTGLTIEMTFLFPVALFALGMAHLDGVGALGRSSAWVNGLLVGTGILTATPLLLFAFGARRIPLSTVGVMQYIAPSLHFLLGVFYYQEAFESAQWITFGMIWVALALYTIDLRQKVRTEALRSRGAD